MKLTVLGGCGAWPAAGQACSGYLAEYGGFRLLIDPGYATLPRLLARLDAAEVDAVLVSHGHPDHCADLHPLLRARVYADDPPAPLPVHAPTGAVDRVVTLDGVGSLPGSFAISGFEPGQAFSIGPFEVSTWRLPHFVLNAGLRLAAGGHVLSYTGDTGPSPDVVELARGADLFLAEATYPEQVPAEDAPYLSSARQAGEYAARSGAGHLLLTHLWPGTDPRLAQDAARRAYQGVTSVAQAGLVVAT
jgi:ribonuclease BN (tRNA processing enzyme)